MDADGLTFAVATTAEERVAKRLGLTTVRVGVCVANGVPEGSLVSFGLAGSLGELRIGDVLDATRVVDETGATLWEGPGSASAAPAPAWCSAATSSSTTRPSVPASARRAAPTPWTWRAASSRAAAGSPASSARSPTTRSSAVEGVDRTVHADGRTNVAGLLRWIATRRGDAVRSMRDALRALHALEEAVAT